MRKAITEAGLPFLTDEYTFTVYWDEGRWWIESSRNGDVIADLKSGGDYPDVGYEIWKVLKENDRFRFDD